MAAPCQRIDAWKSPDELPASVERLQGDRNDSVGGLDALRIGHGMRA